MLGSSSRWIPLSVSEERGEEKSERRREEAIAEGREKWRRETEISDEGDLEGMMDVQDTCDTLVYSNRTLRSVNCRDYNRIRLSDRLLQSYSLKGLQPSCYGAVSEVVLDRNQIARLDDSFAGLVNLRVLSLSDNLLTEIDLVIGKLTSLQELNLKSNQIKECASHLCLLKDLARLNLSGNQIVTLPLYFGLCPKMKFCDVSDNPIHATSPYSSLTKLSPMEFPDRARSDLTAGDTFSVTLYGKIVFVGRENMGKTTLIKSIQHFGSRSKEKERDRFLQTNVATDGVDVTRWGVESRDGRRGVFNLYDFAGQSLFYATHQYFLSPNAVYVIVVTLSSIPIDLRDVRYWLQNISYSAPKSEVVVAATHRERCDMSDADINQHLLDTFRPFVMEFSILKKVFFVDSVTGFKIANFAESLVEIVTKKQDASRSTPIKFEVLLSALMSYRVCFDAPLISIRDLEILAEQIGIRIAGATSAFITYLVGSGYALQVNSLYLSLSPSLLPSLSHLLLSLSLSLPLSFSPSLSLSPSFFFFTYDIQPYNYKSADVIHRSVIGPTGTPTLS